ncbi:MAG: peptidoglycan DD-metalloendopeptidase family protein [Vicinamibacterales bacterium]
MFSTDRLSCGLVLATALFSGACAWSAAGDEGARKGDVVLPAEVHIESARVSPGLTLSSLLHGHHLADGEVASLIQRAASVFDVRRLRTDHPYRLIRALDGVVRGFEYEIDADRVLRVSRTDTEEDFVARIDPIDKRVRPAVVRGGIDSDATSLFASMSRAGERVDLSVALADVLGSEVDFNTELQPGDHFELLVDKEYRAADAAEGESDDTFSGYGEIQAAIFQNEGRTIEAVRFTPRDGKPAYYDRNGRSMRRLFLKSPLKFDPVVTSGFSLSRMHPLLGERRAHAGVDYRAPVGAPVVAVASGVVLKAGWAGDAGRMVHLRHANGYETEYLHLSAIDVRPGQHVQQGDIVGKVGATGLATGPHLDYRVRQAGRFVNPLTVHQSMPPGEPVNPADMPAFAATRDRVLGTLARAVSPRSSSDTGN